MPVINDLPVMYHGTREVRCIYYGATRVWCAGPPAPVWLATVDQDDGGMTDPQNALGQTPGTFTRPNVDNPDTTWLFPTAADLGIPPTAKIDTITVRVWHQNAADVTVEIFHKNSDTDTDITVDTSQRISVVAPSPLTLTVSNVPGSWAEHGFGIRLRDVDPMTGVAAMYQASAVVDWRY